MLRNQRFRQALGKRVSIRPAQLFRAPGSLLCKIIFQPPNPVLADLVFQCLPAQSFCRVFFPERLLLQFLGDFRSFRPRFRRLHQLMQTLPLFFRIEILQVRWCVIHAHPLAHPSIALSRHIAGGKMKQSRVLRSANEFDQAMRRIHIHSQSVSQVWIEIR